jgi:hypothetical protein
MYVYRAVFPGTVTSTYHLFMDVCFITYTGPGQDAKVKTTFKERKKYLSQWDDSWESLFENKIIDPSLIKSAYDELMERFSAELGLHS